MLDDLDHGRNVDIDFSGLVPGIISDHGGRRCAYFTFFSEKSDKITCFRRKAYVRVGSRDSTISVHHGKADTSNASSNSIATDRSGATVNSTIDFAALAASLPPPPTIQSQSSIIRGSAPTVSSPLTPHIVTAPHSSSHDPTPHSHGAVPPSQLPQSQQPTLTAELTKEDVLRHICPQWGRALPFACYLAVGIMLTDENAGWVGDIDIKRDEWHVQDILLAPAFNVARRALNMAHMAYIDKYSPLEDITNLTFGMI